MFPMILNLKLLDLLRKKYWGQSMDGVMNNRPYALIVILATLCVLLIGCNSNSNKKLPFTLQTAYGNKIEQVNGIIIVNGSTGERKEIDDEQAIHQWVDQVRDIK